jgi:hypothetical protein
MREGCLAFAKSTVDRIVAEIYKRAPCRRVCQDSSTTEQQRCALQTEVQFLHLAPIFPMLASRKSKACRLGIGYLLFCPSAMARHWEGRYRFLFDCPIEPMDRAKMRQNGAMRRLQSK